MAECVWNVGAELGEGPVWRAADRTVWFVDIKGRNIHCFDTIAGTGASWRAPDQPGFVAPTRDGRFVAGLKTGLHLFDPAGGSFEFIGAVEPDRPGNRLNDGFVDAQGRLWFGSMDDGETAQTGALYRWHERALTRHDDGICVTNGPCASPDGRTFYHTDTMNSLVYAFDVGDDGALSNKRLFATVEPGAPDGSTVDAEGCVWVALWGGWGVNRYAPSGERIAHISLPVSNVTKVAFGGDDLRTLYITSAWKGLPPDARARQPLAGGLFALRVETPGLDQGMLAL